MKQLRCFLFVITFVIGAKLWAQTVQTPQATVMALPQKNSTGYNDTHRYSIGVMAQAHSVAATSSPWLGVSGSINLNERCAMGLRGFLPVAATVDKSIYSVQAFSRIFLSHPYKTRVFFEPDYAVNFYNFVPFESSGAAIGALNEVIPGMSVGVTGGVEFAKVIVDSVGLENENNVVVYPKIGLTSDFYF